MLIYDLIIIGAGSAGLFAAAASPADWRTLVLEKTAIPGQKLLMTGNGQCNLTNNEPIKDFLNRYGENGKLLRSVLFGFSNIALMSYFEQCGLPLQIREDGKVFPASMKSADVLNTLFIQCKGHGVEFRFESAVTGIEKSNKYRFKINTNDDSFFANNVLVATGGESFPETGSDGSFFKCLEQLGLELVPRRPALTPIFVRDYPYGELSGISIPDSTLRVTRIGSDKQISVDGSLLLTHKCFSGPAILKASRYVSIGDKLTINYLSDCTQDALRLELLQTAAGDARQIATLLGAITGLPRNFLEFICRRCKIEAGEKASRLSGRDMGDLAAMLTSDSYEISGTGGFSDAMVTAGGVSLDEVDLKTMESKKHPGLYFAGEALDVDGDTGGYNLQFAFSSAMLCVKMLRMV